MSEFVERPLLDLVEGLRADTVPLPAYLDQLEAHFAAREPEVRAFLPEEDRFGRLRREAEALLDAYPQPGNRPALFGVPVGVKDIFHVEGFATRAGSDLPPEILQGEEAAAVTALKAAGALILGKTVTTEFAYFAPGPTRNPRQPEHTPGGSSSGSAAAVAAGLCPLALGTQTIGSIVRPAAFCGTVGFKPSYGRISRAGVIPLAPSVDHVGFFVPAAGDITLVAEILCQRWEATATVDRPVLGIPEGPYLDHASEEGRSYFHMACEQLRDAGFTINTVPVMADFEAIEARHNRLVAAEAAEVHSEWFRQFGARYHEKTAELIERGQQVTADQLAADRDGREQLRSELEWTMTEQNVDLWLAPAAVGAAPAGLESTGDPVMNLPWTHAGLPTAVLPIGYGQKGLPLGIQLVARWYQDESLALWAQQIEPHLPA